MATEAEIDAAITLFREKKSELDSVRGERDRAVVARQQIVQSIAQLQVEIDRVQLDVIAARQALKDLL